MDSLELDADSFYICSEISPRNYVVQKAIQIDKSQIERMVGDLEKNAANSKPGVQPSAPPLPYWFTRESKDKLVKVELPNAASPVSPPMFIPPPAAPVDLKLQLKKQLEYYFSRENLMTDRYLRCQMDNDMYVPISVIAGFRKIVQLTNDYNLIVQALRESNVVEVDERGEKVRPITKRCTIILREIAQEHKDEVEKMLAGGPPYLDLKYGLNDSWYITYATEQQTQEAYVHLQGLEVMFNNRPICCRIKTGGPPAHIEAQLQMQQSQTTSQANSISPSAQETDETRTFPPLMDLGTVLTSLGYVPVATYRPPPSMDDESKTPHVPKANSTTSSNHYRFGKNANGRNKGANKANFYPARFEEKPRQDGYVKKNDKGGNRRNTNSHQHQPQQNGGAENRRQTYPSNSMRRPEKKNPPPKPSNNLFYANSIPVWPAPGYAKTPRQDQPSEQEDAAKSETHTEIDNEPSNSQNHRKQSATSQISSSYSFEEQAFPCLPKPVKPEEPPKPPKKPTFSAIAAGKRNQQSQIEARKSYAEKLKEKKLAKSSF